MKPTAQSRVTNHKDVLPNVDGRTALARRYRDIAYQIAADQGGTDHLSEARLQLVRRLAAVSCLAEQMEARLVSGEDINITEDSLLASTAMRIVSRLGIDRIARDASPNPSTHQD